MIQRLKGEAPPQRLCQVFDCPRSTYYYQSVREDETPLVMAIEQVLMRRVLAQLKREGWGVGETVVRRLLKTLGGSRSVGQVRVQTTDSQHSYTRDPNLIRGMKLRQPNPVWVVDITYIRLGIRFIYLAVILDAYSRAVRGWALSRSLSQDLTLDAFRLAAHRHVAGGTRSYQHVRQG